ncbi:TRAP transporter small permease [Qingshengfaniella alkalisoli]|uniref:TRAP transporter small permease protein n=1 Tax=Qingshengfaniella alkalisoli TaxID=2599296 RepID=A0A5B8I9N6_9RHOB|nr:TRAP transporter small permease subunit [Qingshengfaniella alkalisoli]QDY70659.1 TRAP transporter small permease subunit [Qingshengfaniella alkalisoli]
MQIVDRLTRVIVWLCRIGAGLAFALLMAAVLIQVVGRTAGSSPVWTEELTRFALLYLVAFGAGLSFRSGDMVNVDVISETLPGNLPWALRLVSAIATVGLCIYLLSSGWKFMTIGKMQTSPALGLPMNFAHFIVWLMLALLALFAGLRILGMLTRTEDGLPTKAEEL